MNLTKPQQLIYDMEKFAGGAISVICGSMLIRGQEDISHLIQAVKEIYRLNDALRIRISENDSNVMQLISQYIEQDVPVLRFKNKTDLDKYADSYAKVALDLCGNLCEINIVLLPEQYGLLVKMHHLVGDAWTLALMGSQFNALLNGECIQPHSYMDYIDSEKAYISGKRYSKDMEFFLDQFKKCDEVTYFTEKQAHSFSANRKTFVIDTERAKIINAYAEANNTSAFMLFTSALSIYMNRTKMNAEKFYIGTAVLNRSGAKEKNTMGMFINTIPMLIELDNNKSFSENISSIEETAFSSFRHQKYNYGDLLSAIRKEYNFTEKLYDVLISYQNATVEGDKFETTWYHCGAQNESLQIHIDDRDKDGIFRIHYDYLKDKLDEYEIERLHEHICNLLFDAIANDEKCLYQLNILSSEERHKLLVTFNDTAMEYPKNKCVHQLFEDQVKRTPNAIALKFSDKAFTYQELNNLSNGLAVELINRGVQKGDSVAIISKRSYHIVIALLAILKCGAAYLPIDYNYPSERINTIADDAKCKLILTYNVDYESCNTMEIAEQIKPVIENPNIVVNSKDIGGIIYTSGSTGIPKGALLAHQGLVNFTFSNDALSEIFDISGWLNV